LGEVQPKDRTKRIVDGLSEKPLLFGLKILFPLCALSGLGVRLPLFGCGWAALGMMRVFAATLFSETL
jgi:hypothetical protein